MNLRRLSQQIYSLSPLTTRESAHASREVVERPSGRPDRRRAGRTGHKSKNLLSSRPRKTDMLSHCWSWRSESNRQPPVYKTGALPLSYASNTWKHRMLLPRGSLFNLFLISARWQRPISQCRAPKTDGEGRTLGCLPRILRSCRQLAYIGPSSRPGPGWPRLWRSISNCRCCCICIMTICIFMTFITPC